MLLKGLFVLSWVKPGAEKQQTSALFFGREKKKVTRENFTKILDFGREKKKVPVKKGEKPLKSTRENHFLPVKIFGNLHP